MNKKDYQKPTMRIVMLQHQCQILTGSQGLGANRSSYGAANNGIDFNELDANGNWAWN